MDELVYVNDVWQPSADATKEQLEEAHEEATEYLNQAEMAASVARSCARGWVEYCDTLYDRINNFGDAGARDE